MQFSIGIVGAPATGKSYLAQDLSNLINDFPLFNTFLRLSLIEEMARKFFKIFPYDYDFLSTDKEKLIKLQLAFMMWQREKEVSFQVKPDCSRNSSSIVIADVPAFLCYAYFPDPADCGWENQFLCSIAKETAIASFFSYDYIIYIKPHKDLEKETGEGRIHPSTLQEQIDKRIIDLLKEFTTLPYPKQKGKFPKIITIDEKIPLDQRTNAILCSLMGASLEELSQKLKG